MLNSNASRCLWSAAVLYLAFCRIPPKKDAAAIHWVYSRYCSSESAGEMAEATESQQANRDAWLSAIFKTCDKNDGNPSFAVLPEQKCAECGAKANCHRCFLCKQLYCLNCESCCDEKHQFDIHPRSESALLQWTLMQIVSAGLKCITSAPIR